MFNVFNKLKRSSKNESKDSTKQIISLKKDNESKDSTKQIISLKKDNVFEVLYDIIISKDFDLTSIDEVVSNIYILIRNDIKIMISESIISIYDNGFVNISGKFSRKEIVDMFTVIHQAHNDNLNVANQNAIKKAENAVELFGK